MVRIISSSRDAAECGKYELKVNVVVNCTDAAAAGAGARMNPHFGSPSSAMKLEGPRDIHWLGAACLGGGCKL